MRTGLFYLQNAKRHELADLQYLAASTALARACGNTIHQLQRERGLSSLFLASNGQRGLLPRQQQMEATDLSLLQLHRAFDQFDLLAARPGSAMRLYSAMAYALQGVQALPHWRERVATLHTDTHQSTRAYSRLVTALLAVVFEAADTATDPGISRLLVSMFHFMQGKELAGQERATGSAMFASGEANPPQQARLVDLIESQTRSLQCFEELASDSVRAMWLSMRGHEVSVQLERLRAVLRALTPHGALNRNTAEAWFDCCSQRIDLLKAIEDALADHLQVQCQRQAAAIGQELQRLQTLAEPPPSADFFDDTDGEPEAAAEHALESRLGRSVLQLVHAQAQRLAAVNEELTRVRSTLSDRVIIERAKGQLMAQSGLSENDAHQSLRKMAMNQGRRLVDVAHSLTLHG